MSKNYELEVKNRVEYIKKVVADAHVKGIVFGNSGGKDCALVGILCKMACPNTTSIIMPCASSVNYNQDKEDALLLTKQFDIKNEIIDLTATRNVFKEEMEKTVELNKSAIININPRLRMLTLYTYAASHNLLVAGTGNKCERYVGYFTKWGDGAFDFNPISDLLVSEVYGMLEYLHAPRNIIDKKPSAGLYEGQTDELEMGVTYDDIEKCINDEEMNPEIKAKIMHMHKISEHKRQLSSTYKK